MRGIFQFLYITGLVSLSHGWLFSKDNGLAAVTPDGEVIRSDIQASVNFINEAPKAMDIYWDDGTYGKVVASKVETGESVVLSTFVGHTFHWTVHGRRQQV
jgi:hypothetical protein